LAYSTFGLRRADEVVLIDAAFGADIEADLQRMPFFVRWNLDSACGAVPLVDLQRKAGIDPVVVKRALVTHPHWDHVGGLAQVPNARVMVSGDDADWVQRQDAEFVNGSVPFHLRTASDRTDRIVFDGPPLLGFAASKDVFGDGSVIALPTPGHTHGSTSYLVRAVDGPPWLFVGDAAWVKEGFAVPVMKGRLATSFADFDKDRTAETLGRLHAIHAAKAARVVTAHDARTWDGVPPCK
jgi:glyoxylase-like metal-dependent hydrolase (beta-lactamase superfamily II)